MTKKVSKRRLIRVSTARRSAAWSSGQQFVSLASSAVVGVLLARTLSISDFGLYSTAMSLTAIGFAVMNGGVGALGIKVLLDKPDEQARTMSVIILLRELLTAVAFLVLLAVARTADVDATGPTALALLSLFARCLDAPELWFQAQVRTGALALVRVGSIVVMLLARLLLALGGASLSAFLVLFIAEAVLASAGVLIAYLRADGSPGFQRPTLRGCVHLLQQSWPLLLANLAMQVNLRADQVLLQALLGGAAVGIYAAAARLSELTRFLPVVLTTATFPALLAARRQHGPRSNNYVRALQRSYDLTCWSGISIGVLTFLIGPFLIESLFGARYASAALVLRVHVFALPFLFMSAVLVKWQVAEGLVHQALFRQATGAAVNVGLNLLLIPEYGIVGAAVATVVSYTTSSYLFCCVGGREMRRAGRQMTLALLWPFRLLIARRDR